MRRFWTQGIRPGIVGLTLACLLALPALSLTHTHGESLGTGDPSLERPLPATETSRPEAGDCVLCAQGHRSEQSLIAPSLAKAPSTNDLQAALCPEPALIAARGLALRQAARAPPANA